MTQTKQISVGDIYVRQWGLDPTCISFYQIKNVVAKTTCDLQLIASKEIGSEIVPVINDFKASPFRRRLTNKGLIKIIKQEFGDRFYAKRWEKI